MVQAKLMFTMATLALALANAFSPSSQGPQTVRTNRIIIMVAVPPKCIPAFLPERSHYSDVVIHTIIRLGLRDHSCSCQIFLYMPMNWHFLFVCFILISSQHNRFYRNRLLLLVVTFYKLPLQQPLLFSCRVHPLLLLRWLFQNKSLRMNSRPIGVWHSSTMPMRKRSVVICS